MEPVNHWRFCYDCFTKVIVPQSKVWIGIKPQKLFEKLKDARSRGVKTKAEICPECVGRNEVGRGRT